MLAGVDAAVGAGGLGSDGALYRVGHPLLSACSSSSLTRSLSRSISLGRRQSICRLPRCMITYLTAWESV